LATPLGLVERFELLWGAHKLPSGFGRRSPTAKRFMVHFELQIMPSVTQNQQSITNVTQISG